MGENERGHTGVLIKLFGHNTWANLKLLDFCAGLSDEQLAATAIGGYGSIRKTLLHFVASEVGYVNQVNDKLPAVDPRDGVFPGFAALQDIVRWTGEEMLQLALAARVDTLNRTRPPRPIIEYPLASLLVQAMTHSCEHRTQIATIITQLGLEPPDMSGWHYMEELGELQEFGAGAEGA